MAKRTFPMLRDPDWIEAHRHLPRKQLASELGCSLNTVYNAFISTSLTQHGNSKHGQTQTTTYRSWVQARQRCTNPNSDKWTRYGGRGITVCERWDSFENFLADMGERPSGQTLDRVDPDRGYEPANCRWATPKEQATRRSSKNMQKVNDAQVREMRALWRVSGEARSILSDLAEQFGLSYIHTERIVYGKIRQEA